MGIYREDTAAPAEVRPDGPSGANVQSIIQQNYFAALPTNLIGDAIFERIEEWGAYSQGMAHFARIQKAYMMYYGFTQGANTSAITQGGPQGQYSLAFINEYRNTIKHVVNMITSEKIAYDCKGQNTNVKVTESCEIGNIVLEDSEAKLNIDAKLKAALEYGAALSEGYIGAEWDRSKGRPYITDANGNVIFEGDVAIDVFPPWDVVRDWWSKDEDSNWYIVFRTKNKYDLAAKHPELAEQIISCTSEDIWKFRQYYFNANLVGDMCDDIVEVTLYHKKTPAVPRGRTVRLVRSDVILSDGPLEYDDIPLARMVPDKIIETPLGYTFAFDLLGVQDLTNLSDSITATIFKTFGVGLVKLPIGHNADYQQISEGLAALVVNESNGKMEAMNLAKLPDGLSQFREFLSSRQDIISGINSVIRGQPDSNIKAGNFAALIASQAYQFMNTLQNSYYLAAKKVGQLVIDSYKKFAKNERIVETAGSAKEYAVKSFTADKLQDIRSVSVDVSSASTRSPAARMNMADVLTGKGAINSVDQYVEILKTGNLDHATERKETENDGINRENEMLRRGQNPPVMPTDNPFKHVQRHLMICDDPEIRAKHPEVIKAVTDHILTHTDMWQNVTMGNISLLQLMNVAPAQMPQMGMPPPAPNAAPNAQSGAEASGEMPQPAQPSEGLPPLPKNPLTGAPPPVGAGPLGSGQV